MDSNTAMTWRMTVLKWSGGILLFFVLWMSGMAILMFWDGYQLERELQRLAASFTANGSPFTIPLPADRIVLLTSHKTNSNVICAVINIKQGVVRSAQIGGIKQAVVFHQGVDLNQAAETLTACDQWRITLMANWSFLKGEITINYAGTQITEIGVPRLWD
jgi:hypothetical protein